jgi:DNA-binding IclR family transcriptional regulator
MESNSEAASASPASSGGVPRVFSVIRALGAVQAEGGRVTQIARSVGLTQATTHRLLQALMAEGMVEQDERTKLYRLGIDFFALAASAGNPGDLRSICRPVLLRLCASLGDSIFLLARSGFDAVCLDRSEGPFPIRSFTGDIGGRIALGVGQGALAILAFLPEAEREEVIRFNLSRVREYGVYDEVYLRTEIERVRQAGLRGAQHRAARRHGGRGGADPRPRRARGGGAERGHDCRPAQCGPHADGGGTAQARSRGHRAEDQSVRCDAQAAGAEPGGLAGRPEDLVARGARAGLITSACGLRSWLLPSLRAPAPRHSG